VVDDATYLSTAALAARLGVSESTIRNWRKAGRIVDRLDPDGVRRYPLEVFERVALLRERGVSLAGLAEALAQDGDGIPLRSDRVLELLEQIAADVRSVAADLRRIADVLDRPVRQG
jgi:DNA-binding transcriptional MerR regulator